MHITIPSMSRLREFGHALIAPVGALAFLYGGVVDLLKTQDVIHVSTATSNWIALVGGAIALASKAVDSLNNALVTRSGQAAPPPFP